MRRKSIILTIVAVILYLSQSFIRGILIGTLNENEIFAELSSAFLVLLIIFFLIGKKERRSYFGIRIWECDNCFKINGLLFLIPLVNLPYLLFGARINIIVAVISSIFVGIMEELIFRGFLCRFIEEKSCENRAIMISSLIFGVFHLVNIGSDPYLYVLLQVLYAFAIGIVFATVFYKTKSILNCMIVHSIVDILGSFEAEPIFAVEIIGTMICVLCAIYYYLFERFN